MSEDRMDALRARVRARYPGEGEAASPEYWDWWVRWQRASVAEKERMEAEL